MNERVTVHLARRGQEDARIPSPREIERVHGAEYARQRRVNGIRLIMDRTRRTGEVENAVHVGVEWLGHVMLDEREARASSVRGEVAHRAGGEIVERDNSVSLLHES